MPKPTKTALAKYRKMLETQLAALTGDVGSMRDEALRASEQDSSVDHLAENTGLIGRLLTRDDADGEWRQEKDRREEKEEGGPRGRSTQ